MIQRVNEVRIIIENKVYSIIEKGLLVFLGVHGEVQIEQIK